MDALRPRSFILARPEEKQANTIVEQEQYSISTEQIARQTSINMTECFPFNILRPWFLRTGIKSLLSTALPPPHPSLKYDHTIPYHTVPYP